MTRLISVLQAQAVFAKGSIDGYVQERTSKNRFDLPLEGIGCSPMKMIDERGISNDSFAS